MAAPFALDWLTRPPYRDLHSRFLRATREFTTFPKPERFDELARQVPRATGVVLPRFVAQSREAVRGLGGYEQHVARRRAVPTRDGDWHDFFNMVVWAHWPCLRWALNALHVDPEAGPIDPRNGRAPAQNSAATFDESGVIAISTSRGVLDELRALRFKSAFWGRRAEVLATTRFWVVGHGMLEALLKPRPGLVARGLLLHVPALPERESDSFRFEIDARVAAEIENWRVARPVLDPIPVLAIPGYSDNDCGEFYDDAHNVRFEPVSRRPCARA